MMTEKLLQNGCSATESTVWEKNPNGLKYGAINEYATEIQVTPSPAVGLQKRRWTSSCADFGKKLVRRKVFTEDTLLRSDLHRCLSTFDLINLGIGSCICNGIYIVVGQVAKVVAGPGVLLSFLVAGIASSIAGLCYAEFASRVPRAGSAYIYSYVTVGQLMAFVIGWNLLLEYIIGTSCSARAWSMYLDALVGERISKFFREYMPMNITGLSEYPDFVSFGITALMTVLLAAGVRESARFNNIFTGVNILVIIYVIICGFFKVDLHNWQWTLEEMPTKGAGLGGFLPYGFSGVMSGAATCFYAYIGFDCIATTGEESRNPEKTVPVAIVSALLIILISYCSVAVVVTLMVPYFLLDVNAPLPFVFQYVGWDLAKYIIGIGAMCGLSTSLLGSMFPLPRVLYAMGNDGLIFRIMAKVSPRFKTPLFGTLTSGFFAGAMAMIFNLEELIKMMSIGTLLAYTLVAVCVLILRYEVDDAAKVENGPTQECAPFRFRQLMFPADPSNPSDVTSIVTKICVAVMCCFIVALSTVLAFLADYLTSGEIWAIAVVALLAFLIIVVLVFIARQPQSKSRLHFKVPGLPYLPAASCMMNIYLMLKLDPMTWVRFGVWMAVGFAIYFLYGIWNTPSHISDESPAADSTCDQEKDCACPILTTTEKDVNNINSNGYGSIQAISPTV